MKPLERDRINSFLEADGDHPDSVLIDQLEQSADCRAYFDAQVAPADQWNLVGRLLQPDQHDRATKLGFSAGSDAGHQARQSASIQEVLDTLAPTDDPHRLGRLGSYEVTGVIGAGGMGVVLKAFEPSLDRVVAIKVLAPHLAHNEKARQRFEREARAAAAVIDPNVIPIYSVASDGKLPYLAMACIQGGSLQQRLDSQGAASVPEVLRIGSQIASGLAAAHEQGLVHRDIKPENILFEGDVERVSITDFGLARAVDDNTVTQAGTIAGTPMYMSPEQARGEQVDQQSDLFSLGSVLYALCTGQPPYCADSSLGVMRKITDELPTPIRELNPDTPEWLADIIEKLMARDKAVRFSSAAEVRDLLENCLSHVQAPETVTLPEQLQSNRGSGFTGLRFLAGAFSALLAAAVFFIVTNNGIVKVEVLDDSFKVAIDGTNVTVAEDGTNQSIKLRAGDHKVVVSLGDTELITDNFELRRNGEVALRIEVLEGEVILKQDNKRVDAKTLSESQLAQTKSGPASSRKSLAGPEDWKARLSKLVAKDSIVVTGTLEKAMFLGKTNLHRLASPTVVKGKNKPIEEVYAHLTLKDEVYRETRTRNSPSMPVLKPGEYVMVLETSESINSFAASSFGFRITREPDINYTIVRDGKRHAAWPRGSKEAQFVLDLIDGEADRQHEQSGKEVGSHTDPIPQNTESHPNEFSLGEPWGVLSRAPKQANQVQPTAGEVIESKKLMVAADAFAKDGDLKAATDAYLAAYRLNPERSLDKREVPVFQKVNRLKELAETLNETGLKRGLFGILVTRHTIKALMQDADTKSLGHRLLRNYFRIYLWETSIVFQEPDKFGIVWKDVPDLMFFLRTVFIPPDFAREGAGWERFSTNNPLLNAMQTFHGLHVLREFRGEVRSLTAEHPAWKGGQILLAVLECELGNVETCRSIIHEHLTGPEGPAMPRECAMVLGQCLEGRDPDLDRLVIRLYEYSVKTWVAELAAETDFSVTSLERSPLQKLARVYAKYDRKAEARQLLYGLVNLTDQHPLVQGYKPGLFNFCYSTGPQCSVCHAKEMNLNSFVQMSDAMTDIGYPVDSLISLARIDKGFKNAYSSSKGWIEQTSEEGRRFNKLLSFNTPFAKQKAKAEQAVTPKMVIEALERGTFENLPTPPASVYEDLRKYEFRNTEGAVKYFADQLKPEKKADGVIDLRLSVRGVGPKAAPMLFSPVIDILKLAADYKGPDAEKEIAALDARLRLQSEVNPNDLQAAITATVFAFLRDDIETAGTRLARLVSLAEAHPRTNEADVNLYLAAEYAVEHKETAEAGRRLARRAIEAGKKMDGKLGSFFANLMRRPEFSNYDGDGLAPFQLEELVRSLLKDEAARPRGIHILKRLWTEHHDTHYNLLTFHPEEIWPFVDDTRFFLRSKLLPANIAAEGSGWGRFKLGGSYELSEEPGWGYPLSLRPLLKDKDALRALAEEVEAAVGEHPEWAAGTAVLSYLEAGIGNYERATELLRQVSADAESLPIPSDAAFIFGMALEGKSAELDLEVMRLYELSLQNRPARPFRVSAIPKLGRLYAKYDQPSKARQTLHRLSTPDYDPVSSNVCCSPKRRPSNRGRCADCHSGKSNLIDVFVMSNNLTSVGYPVDSYVALARIDESFNDAYGSADAWAKVTMPLDFYSDIERGRTKFRRARHNAASSLTPKNALEALKAGVFSGRDMSNPMTANHSSIDLQLSVSGRSEKHSVLHSPVIEVLWLASQFGSDESEEADTRNMKRIDDLLRIQSEIHSNDVQAAIASTMSAFVRNDMKTARQRLKRLDNLELSTKPEDQLANAGLWIVARHTLQYDSMKAIADSLTAKALAAAEKLSDPAIKNAINSERSQDEIEPFISW